MKENDRLGYFEQLFIKRKAEKDAINQCFIYIHTRENKDQLMKYDEIGFVPLNVQYKANVVARFIRFFKSIGKEIRSNETNPYNYMKSSNQNSKKLDSYFALSQYLLTEVASFVSKRDYSLSNDKVDVYLINRKGKKKKKRLKMGRALSLLDLHVNELKAVQKNIYNSFLENQKELNIKYEKAKEGNYLHKIKLYENIKQKSKVETDTNIDNLEVKINFLYSEKQRILKEKQAELLSRRSRIFLRIRYYLECANHVNPNIGIMLYNEDDLNYYTGLDFNVLNTKCMEELKNIETKVRK